MSWYEHKRILKHMFKNLFKLIFKKIRNKHKFTQVMITSKAKPDRFNIVRFGVIAQISYQSNKKSYTYVQNTACCRV